MLDYFPNRHIEILLPVNQASLQKIYLIFLNKAKFQIPKKFQIFSPQTFLEKLHWCKCSLMRIHGEQSVIDSIFSKYILTLPAIILVLS